MNDNSPSVKAILLFILLSLIWGTSFILIKQGLKVFSPQEVGALRVTAAAVFLLPFAILKLKEFKPSHYGKLLLSGLLAVFFPSFLFALAQTKLESSVTGIGNSLTPILTLIIGVIVFGQQLRKGSLIGVLIGLVGTIFLITANSSGGLGSINSYFFLVILACMMYASNLNYVKYKISDLQPMTITSVSLMLIGVLAVFYLFGFSDFVHSMETRPGAWKAFGFVCLLGLMSTSLAMFIFNNLVKLTSPLFTSSITYVIPLVAVMWGLLDGERLYTGHYVGMAAIIGGVYLANRRR
jgi:drug/metabolite transporter (DMT)-like permease